MACHIWVGMFDNKSILITASTGSFGNVCVQWILSRYQPRRLVIFSCDELKQYEMQQRFGQPQMRYFIGDVRDTDFEYQSGSNQHFLNVTDLRRMNRQAIEPIGACA